MIDNLMNILFRCSHRRISRPVTPASQPGAQQAETYVVCLDCGKRFVYDFKAMKIGRAIDPPPATKLLPPDPKEHHGLRLALFASAISALIAIFGFRRSRSH